MGGSPPSEKGRKWIAKRYFSQIGNQKWCFSVGFNKRNPESRITLIKLSNTNIERYTKIKREANPFDPEWKEYFETRETNKMLSNLKGRKTLLQLWEKQGRKCPVCGSAIDKESKWSMSENYSQAGKSRYLSIANAVTGVNATTEVLSRLLFKFRSLELLEPYAMKVARTVLRGERGSNAPDLLDHRGLLHHSNGGKLDSVGWRYVCL